MRILSVIIVTYNSEKDIVRCLNSVMAGVPPSTEVLVVDNHSHDTTVETIRNRFSWVKLLALPENVGFAAGNNKALPFTESNYLLLLNPDTELCGDAISKMIEYMDEHPKCGICGPTLQDGEGTLAPSLPWPSTLNIVLNCVGVYRALPERSRNGSVVLSGACMLIRSSVIQTVGFLDVHMHTQEDVDFCVRVLQAGYSTAHVHEAKVTHFIGKSGNVGFVIRRSYESAFRLHRKHTRPLRRQIVYLALSAELLLRYFKWKVVRRRTPEAVERCRAFADVLQRLPELWRSVSSVH